MFQLTKFNFNLNIKFDLVRKLLFFKLVTKLLQLSFILKFNVITYKNEAFQQLEIKINK